MPDEGKRDDFLAAVFAAERPCVSGKQDFGVALEGVLERYQCDARVEDVLDIWTLIEPNSDVLALVRELQQSGHRVCLATNQQAHRARYMARELGYDDLFDLSFYSCEVGHAKPERGYFLEMVRRLESRPTELLFIDDSDANVAAARDLGIRAEQFHLTEGVDVLRERLRFHRVSI